MAPPASHLCRVLPCPWPGVHGTDIDSARHYGKHWHSTYGVGLVTHGAQRSASGRGRVDALAGDVITTNPGEVHDGQPLAGASRRWRMVYFDPAVLTAMHAAPGSSNAGDLEFTRPVIADPALARALRQLFTLLARWADSRDALDALACEEAFVHACGQVLARHTNAAPLSEVHADVRAVRERLADQARYPPPLAELAQMAGLGKYQLLRRFTAAYGVPPHAWLRLQRAERARALIRSGATLAEAAAASGFADQSHMTRHFARQFGFTPGVWQAAFRTRPQ